jgi:hypothetical protein
MHAERNRALKLILSKAFAPHKVTVRGSRGTSYGWVRVHIGYAPRNSREAQELRSQVFGLIAAAKIEIGTYGYDDPGSDYGHGSKIYIDFDPWREGADAYGPEAWRQHLSAEQWDALQREAVR